MNLVKESWFDNETSAGVFTNPEEVTGAVRYGLQVNTTGSPSSFQVILEGSINGTSWVTLVTATASTPIVSYGHNAAHLIVKYIRLNLDQLNGGTSPTLTASVLAV